MFVNVTNQYTIKSGILGNEQYIVMLEWSAVTGIIITLLGILSNMITIGTFISMGVKDGVTVSFFALSIFDLAYLIAGLSLTVNVLLYATELKSNIRFSIEPYGLTIYFSTVMNLINITNVLTTTFLAVVRSMCVARPLQFKNSFTRDRAIMFMVMFAVFAISLELPMFLNMGMSNRFVKLTNTSRPSWWRSTARESVKEIVWAIADGILPVSSEFIIIICVVILSNSLRESSKFRQSSVAVFDKRSSNMDTEHTNKINDSNFGKTTVAKLTGKDVKVVQQVVLISVVYIICTFPKLLISLITTIEPDFAIGGRYVKLYISTNGLRKHFEVINSAINLIIYYKYNTKFRSTLLQRCN